MSESNLQHAPHTRMDERQALADEFFRATDAELIPSVSDHATWYDFDYMDDAEVTAAIESHYGVTVDSAVLSLQFWKLLDLLAETRKPPDV